MCLFMEKRISSELVHVINFTNHGCFSLKKKISFACMIEYLRMFAANI